MHALVSTVLVRFAGLDEFGEDPDRDPPDGELREARDGRRSEGWCALDGIANSEMGGTARR